MATEPVLVGLVIDDHTLSLDELACACGVPADWLQQRLDAGLLTCCESAAGRFASAQLHRARRLRALEQDFDANQELAALVVDLLDEIQRLRSQR
jgi:chaperone modulatory protein CbpM